MLSVHTLNEKIHEAVAGRSGRVLRECEKRKAEAETAAQKGDHETSVKLLEINLAWCKRKLEPNHEMTVWHQEELAVQLANCETFGDALPYDMEAYSARNQVDPDADSTLKTLGHYAWLLATVGGVDALEQAADRFEVLWKRQERSPRFGAAHPDTLQSISDSARCYVKLAKKGQEKDRSLERARRLHQRVVDAVADEKSAEVLEYREDLARVHMALGDSPRAVSIYKQNICDSQLWLSEGLIEPETAETARATARKGLEKAEASKRSNPPRDEHNDMPDRCPPSDSGTSVSDVPQDSQTAGASSKSKQNKASVKSRQTSPRITPVTDKPAHMKVQQSHEISRPSSQTRTRTSGDDSRSRPHKQLGSNGSNLDPLVLSSSPKTGGTGDAKVLVPSPPRLLLNNQELAELIKRDDRSAEANGLGTLSRSLTQRNTGSAYCAASHSTGDLLSILQDQTRPRSAGLGARPRSKSASGLNPPEEGENTSGVKSTVIRESMTRRTQSLDQQAVHSAVGVICDARPGEENDGGVEKWFADIQKINRSIYDPYRRSSGKKIKIAVLDTGLDVTNPYFLEPSVKRRIKKFADFINPGASNTATDSHGHGTHCVGIINRVAPEADIYVGRVADDLHGHVSEDVVAAAIRKALGPKIDGGWDADMLSLSWGFPFVSDLIGRALNDTLRDGKLVLAAASNHGTRGLMAYPASRSGVIAVHSASAAGTPSDFNSRFREGKNLCIVGENVAYQPGSDSKSGTSMATPMLAGMVALLLEAPRLAPQDEQPPLGRYVEKYDGMMALLTQGFGVRPNNAQGFYFVEPSKLFDEGDELTDVTAKMRVILREQGMIPPRIRGNVL